MTGVDVKGKKIEGLSPDMPAREAARWVLHLRLRAVERLLSNATSGAEMDERSIHRLRVSTRRAAAALRAFEAWVPRKARRRMARRLRHVRRTAGEARMCDVHTEHFRRLLADVDPALAPSIGLVIGRLIERRKAAGRAVRDLRDRDARRLRRARRKVLRSIEREEERAADARRPRAAFADLASEEIPALARRMDEIGRADLTIIDNVHALRIMGKRVRYAVEIFECCFAPATHEALLARLVEFQDHLGGMNDLWEMKQRVEECAADPALHPDFAEGLSRLALELSGRVDRAHRSFLDWWSSRGIESIFGPRIVTRPAGPGEARPPDDANGRMDAAMDRIIEDATRHMA